MFSSRVGRSRPACLAICLLHACALLPNVAAANEAASTVKDKSRLSQAEVIIGASTLGAGFALVLASYYVEDKHTDKISFWAHDEYHGPIEIRSGTNTSNLLVVGAGLLFIGAAMLAAPAGEDDNEGRDAALRQAREPGFQLHAMALEGGAAAVALARGF